ncbi:MAG: hypothetical protein SGCHY_001621 [Lobulomycetales sp.]
MLVLMLGSVLLLLAPYTKVEESFNVQATHDLLLHSPFSLPSPDSFDHLSFPGPVPRTFVGPAALYTVLAPFNVLFSPPKPLLLAAARFLLLAAVDRSLDKISSAVGTKYGQETAAYFQLFNAVNFHLLFWGSRLLPNMFAFVLSNFALAFWLAQKTTPKPDKHVLTAYQTFYLALMVSATALFRSELVLLFAPIIALEIFYWKSMQLQSAFWACYHALSRAIFVSVLVDSWFWQKSFYWPELKVFIFNVIENKSAFWGTSPFHAYFTNLLPRIAFFTYPLSLAAVVLVPSTRRYMIPALLFLTVYSFLPHKEWRFVIYVLPIVNFSAAALVARVASFLPAPASDATLTQGSGKRPVSPGKGSGKSLDSSRKGTDKRSVSPGKGSGKRPVSPGKGSGKSLDSSRKGSGKRSVSPGKGSDKPLASGSRQESEKRPSLARQIFRHCIHMLCLLSLLHAAVSAYISRQNYPGAEALRVVNEHAEPGARVHIDAFNAGTGVSLFAQTRTDLMYSKDEAVGAGLGMEYLLREAGRDVPPGYDTMVLVHACDGVRVKSMAQILADLREAVVGGHVGWDGRVVELVLPVRLLMAPKSRVLRRRDNPNSKMN